MQKSKAPPRAGLFLPHMDVQMLRRQDAESSGCTWPHECRVRMAEKCSCIFGISAILGGQMRRSGARSDIPFGLWQRVQRSGMMDDLRNPETLR